jgi:uncharacterized protein (TIGR02284 family)
VQHSTQNDISVVKDLVTTLEDGREGFATVAESLDESGHSHLASRMRDFAAERGRMSAELRQYAGKLGEEIEPNGSAVGALHRGWISVKDALTGDDAHAVLAAAEEGEDHAVKAYEEALEENEISPALRELVTSQAAIVRNAHDTVRDLRDSLDN